MRWAAGSTGPRSRGAVPGLRPGRRPPHQDGEGSVTALAGRGDPHPGAALLRDLHRVDGTTGCEEALSAALIEGHLRLHERTVVLPQPVGPQPAPRFLVGRDDHQDVTAQRYSVRRQQLHDEQARRDLPLHVQRAPAPDAAVRHLTREGWPAPVLGLGTHHVRVPEQHQRRPVARARQPGDHIGPPRLGLQHGVPDPAAVQFSGEVPGDGDLVPGRVGGVQAYEVREVADQMLLLIGPLEGQLEGQLERSHHSLLTSASVIREARAFRGTL